MDYNGSSDVGTKARKDFERGGKMTKETRRKGHKPAILSPAMRELCGGMRGDKAKLGLEKPMRSECSGDGKYGGEGPNPEPGTKKGVEGRVGHRAETKEKKRLSSHRPRERSWGGLKGLYCF